MNKANNERIYTIPLGKAYEKPRTKRTPRAVKLVRAFIKRHMKVESENDVKISNNLNKVLWSRSIQKPPRRVRVRAIVKEGIAYVYHVDEQIPEPKDKEKKETKEEKTKDKKEEVKEKTEAKKDDQKQKPKDDAQMKK